MNQNDVDALGTISQDVTHETTQADLTDKISSMGAKYMELYEEFKELQSKFNGLKEEQDNIIDMMGKINKRNQIHLYLFDQPF